MTIDPSATYALKNQLRQQLRKKRRSLSQAQQQQAASALAQNLNQHLWFKQAQHLGFYLPNDGEIDPTPLLNIALALGKHCYLPAVLDGGRLQFREIKVGTRLTLNRYKIVEPHLGARVRPAWLLDLVLLPLVGFDLAGNRLGMGGGYYDRTFAATKGKPRPSRRRIGLAHCCQKVDAIKGDNWDISLAAIATEQGVTLVGN